MKWFLLFCIWVVPGFALTPPAPIKGKPNIQSKQLDLTFGNTNILFAFPQGWGMGATSSSAQEGTGYFELYPIKGGTGCRMEMRRYDDEEAMQNKMASLQNTFKTITPLNNGFEVEFPKAYYACIANQLHLTQIWYAFEKTKAPRSNWETLRDCFIINLLVPVEEKFALLQQKKYEGWLCNHPNKKLHILFKSYPHINCTPNEDAMKNYLLQFDSHDMSGYFYVNWDQSSIDTPTETSFFDFFERFISKELMSLNTEAPFRSHLELMMNDLELVNENQKYDKYGPTYDLENGYAIWNGSPYTLLSISGGKNPFMIGFVVKSKFSFKNCDPDNLLKKVIWWTDE